MMSLIKRFICLFLIIPFMAAFGASLSRAEEQGVEILDRGPIHEAYAEPGNNETSTGVVVTSPVPEPIKEIPPDYRPEGDHVEWIPGYWSWDEDRNSYIWVSGIWRDIPPDRQWVPGYWTTVPGGYRYISGYWASSEQATASYLPPPPAPLHTGPSYPAPSSSYVWISGCWIWAQSGYVWQAGYWRAPRHGMIWIPARYVWAPRGYVFVMGYWDYPLGTRGVLFAPIYYSRPLYRNHGYYYRPHRYLDTTVVFNSVYYRHNSHHYYFGDYSDRHHEKRGYYPYHPNHDNRYRSEPWSRQYQPQRHHDYRGNNRSPERYEPARSHGRQQGSSLSTKQVGSLFGDAMDKSRANVSAVPPPSVKPQQNYRAPNRNHARNTNPGFRQPERTSSFGVPARPTPQRNSSPGRLNRQIGGLFNQQFSDK